MVGWVSPSVSALVMPWLWNSLLMCIVCLSTCNWCMPSQKGKCNDPGRVVGTGLLTQVNKGAVAEASEATCIYNAFVCY